MKIITPNQLFLLCVLQKQVVEARNTIAFGSKESIFRMFSVSGPTEIRIFELHELTDRSACWATPGQLNNTLAYTGDFELKEPLTPKEEFVMLQFFSKQASFVSHEDYAKLEKEFSNHE